MAKENEAFEKVKLELSRSQSKNAKLQEDSKRLAQQSESAYKNLISIIKDEMSEKCSAIKTKLTNALLKQRNKMLSFEEIVAELLEKYEDLKHSKHKLNDLQVQLERAANECEQLRSKNASLVNELLHKSTAFSKNKGNNEMLLVKVKIEEWIKNVRDNLVKALELKCKHFDAAKDRIKEGVSSAFSNLYEQLTNKKRENQLLSEEAKRLKNELIAKQNILEQMKAGESSMRQQMPNFMNKLFNSYNSAFKNALENMENKFHRLEEIVNNLGHGYTEQNNALAIEEQSFDAINGLFETAIDKIDKRVNAVSDSLTQLKPKIDLLQAVVKSKAKERDAVIERLKGESSGSSELMTIIQEKIEKKNDELSKAHQESARKIQRLNTFIDELRLMAARGKDAIYNYKQNHLKNMTTLDNHITSSANSFSLSLLNIKKKISELNNKFKELRNKDYAITKNEIETLEDERNAAINEAFELRRRISHLEDSKSPEGFNESEEDREQAKEYTERSLERSEKEIKECSSSQEQSRRSSEGSPPHFMLVTKDIQEELSHYGDYIQDAIEEVRYNQNEMTNIITSCRSIIREKLGGKEMEFNLTVDELKTKLEIVERANKKLKENLEEERYKYKNLEVVNEQARSELEDTRRANEDLCAKLVALQEKDERRSAELEEIKSGTHSLSLEHQTPRKTLTDTDRSGRNFSFTSEPSDAAVGEHVKKLIVQCIESVPAKYFALKVIVC
eukprot:TRINITY_DN2210_c0_g1_i2.p1 TRINITY_DN2210_c0_g1~~TRINITY_DN2210_c0_g1_i2.p1  ORF type:complete len:733 (-),score=190.99 TRINITY_DN2210_c0_g1_i2:209-2407(-)